MTLDQTRPFFAGNPWAWRWDWQTFVGTFFGKLDQVLLDCFPGDMVANNTGNLVPRDSNAFLAAEILDAKE